MIFQRPLKFNLQRFAGDDVAIRRDVNGDPAPQYFNPNAGPTGQYEYAEGSAGAPKVQLYGPNGEAISTSNRLPVDVGGQVATEQTLLQAVNRLNDILSRLQGTLTAAIRDSSGNPITTSNRLPVDVGGQIHADVDLGDVTVQIGELQQGKRGPNAEPWEVTLSGRIVEVIIEHIGRTDLIGAVGVRYFADGVGVGASAPPVDVRPYARRLIHIRNGHDESIVARVFGYFSFHTSGLGNHRVGPIAEVNIPAGAAMTFSPEEYVGLTTPYPGLSVQLSPVSTSATGDVDVIYVGARI